MVIKSLTETSYKGMYKISPEKGSAFFIRQEYLPDIQIDDILPGTVFENELEEQLLDAGLISVVELKAVDYLARAEQSHIGLQRKLIEKKYDKKYIEIALSFLESQNYLSDARFARAWLNGRRINHYEGRTRLLAELMSRGIEREVSVLAIDDFFNEFNEFDIAEKAYKKFVKQGKEQEKLVAAMQKAGFSYSMIKRVKEKISEEYED